MNTNHDAWLDEIGFDEETEDEIETREDEEFRRAMKEERDLEDAHARGLIRED